MKPSSIQLDQFIVKVMESVNESGKKPSSVRFQLNIIWEAPMVSVCGAKISVDGSDFQIPDVTANENDIFGLDFTIPCGPWPDAPPV